MLLFPRDSWEDSAGRVHLAEPIAAFQHWAGWGARGPAEVCEELDEMPLVDVGALADAEELELVLVGGEKVREELGCDGEAVEDQGFCVTQDWRAREERVRGGLV